MQATNRSTSEAAAQLECVLPVALLRVARRLKTASSRTREEAWALLLLHQVGEKGRCRVSDLAGNVGMDTSTVSRHIAKLEEAGYVERTGDPADRRASRLDLTRTGRRLLARATQARADLIRTAVADWPAQDVHALGTLMSRLADALDPNTPDARTHEPKTHDSKTPGPETHDSKTSGTTAETETE